MPFTTAPPLGNLRSAPPIFEPGIKREKSPVSDTSGPSCAAAPAGRPERGGVRGANAPPTPKVVAAGAVISVLGDLLASATETMVGNSGSTATS